MTAHLHSVVPPSRKDKIGIGRMTLEGKHAIRVTFGVDSLVVRAMQRAGKENSTRENRSKEGMKSRSTRGEGRTTSEGERA